MYETEDTNIRNTLYVGAGLIGLIGFALLLSWGAYSLVNAYTARPGGKPVTFVQAGNLPPAPHLQADPHADLMRLRAAEDSVLLTYGWVNRDSALVRIPVARAMELLVKRGVPSVAKSGADTSKED